MRILVFGGSFDPPHRGHAALLNAAARRIRPDRILIVPAFLSPFKESHGASPAERLRLIRLGLIPGIASRWRGRTRIDTGELRRRRRVYAIETLRRIARRHPGAELHFVVGSDAAAGFPRWRSPARLRRLAAWWAAARPRAARPPSFFGRVPGAMPDLSSSELRRRLALGEPVGGALPPRALADIRRRGLYGARIAAELRRTLPPERFAHSVAVACWAERLAESHDEDAGRARLAGLLHDCGRRLPVSAMAAYAARRRVRAPDRAATARRNPLLLHAYVGADIARRLLGVRDRAVLAAIASHTLGRPGMGRLERVLYVADACSPDRAFRGAARLRALARRDLEAAFRACVRNKLEHARRGGGWLHPQTLRLWKSLRG